MAVEKQYVEAVEQIIPLDSCRFGIRRLTLKIQGESKYILRFCMDRSEDVDTEYVDVHFVSSRGRDGAYFEIINNLGRTSLIAIGRYQEWTSSGVNK